MFFLPNGFNAHLPVKLASLGCSPYQISGDATMHLTFDQRRERFWKTRDDAKRLIYKMAERISEIPPELAEYFAEAQRLRLLFEEDQTDFIASQMGLPKLDERDPMFSDHWVCKPLHDVHKNQAFRKPLGASGRLDSDLWIKREYVEPKDKYRVE
ncbi:MAG: hypothetical protein ACO349_07960, partial [Flavobacteriaceae bacterium]